MSPGATAYENARLAVPDPEAYAAAPPVSSASEGRPCVVLADTASEKVTLTMIVSPAPYGPVAFGDETFSTRGRTPSTDRPDVPASERLPDGAGRSRFAGLPAASSTVPPLRERADAFA